MNKAAVWVTGKDTGVSSKTIWGVMMGIGGNPDTWVGAPHDDDDFGRCYRLLKLIPSWRARLPEMAKAFPRDWGPLIKIWTELEELHKAGKSGEVCDMIRTARNP